MRGERAGERAVEPGRRSASDLEHGEKPLTDRQKNRLAIVMRTRILTCATVLAAIESGQTGEVVRVEHRSGT